MTPRASPVTDRRLRDAPDLGHDAAENALRIAGAPMTSRFIYAAIVLLAFSAASRPTQTLVLRDHMAHVGTLNGPEEVVFGDITDALVITTGIVILDQSLNQLRLYASDGTPRRQISRPGRGPGELSRPAALAVTAHGLDVLDAGSQRVTRFTVSLDTAYYSGEIPLDFNAFDICELNGVLFSLGFREGRSIHAFVDGKASHSFGAAWGPPHPLLRRSLSRGYLACSKETGLVIAGSLLIPELRAFNSHGRPLWSYKVPHFVTVAMRSNHDGSVTYSTPAVGYYEQLVSLHAFDNGFIVAQIGRVYPSTSTKLPAGRLRTIILDPSGRLIGEQTNLPRIVAVSTSKLLVSHEEPYPCVDSWTYEWSAAGE